MSEPTHADNAHDDTHHDDHGGLGKYAAVFVALCVLTTASFMTYTDFWRNSFSRETIWVGWAFMMAVSCTKAMLVILFFMHLKWEANWKYVLTIPAGMMSIFFTLMLVPDVGWRMNKYDKGRVQHSADMPAASSSLEGDADHQDH